MTEEQIYKSLCRTVTGTRNQTIPDMCVVISKKSNETEAKHSLEGTIFDLLEKTVLSPNNVLF